MGAADQFTEKLKERTPDSRECVFIARGADFCAVSGIDCRRAGSLAFWQRKLPAQQDGGGTMKQECVCDWMTREVITISPNTSLAEAHKLMMEKSIRRLPVLHDGRLVGIVTLGDVRGAEPAHASSLNIWEMDHLLAKLKTLEFMTQRPVTILENASIRDAAFIMLEKKFSGLPVVNEAGGLVGIITESDIFRLVATRWREDEG